MTTPTVRRPGLVTLLVALTVIGGIVAIVAGIVAMITTGSFLSAGIIFVVLGLIYLAVAKGLADGNSVSRAIVAVVSVLQIAYAIITIVTTDNNGNRNSAIGSAVVGLIILLILFSPKANAFFDAHSG